jgi:hypothetical protein
MLEKVPAIPKAVRNKFKQFSTSDVYQEENKTVRMLTVE